MVVAGPAAGVAEAGKLERGRPERAAAGGERDIDARVAEADDVGHAVAVHVGELARILVVAVQPPAPGAKLESSKVGKSKPLFTFTT